MQNVLFDHNSTYVIIRQNWSFAGAADKFGKPWTNLENRGRRCKTLLNIIKYCL